MKLWKKKKDTRIAPSPEAIQARIHAHSITLRADEVFGERDRLIERNHWADRIRAVYANEG